MKDLICNDSRIKKLCKNAKNNDINTFFCSQNVQIGRQSFCNNLEIKCKSI